MRIGIPARGLQVRSGGAKEYVRNILLHLPAEDRSNEYYIYYANSAHVLGIQLPNVREQVIPKWSDLFWDQLSLPLRMRRDAIELAFFPKGTIPLLCRSKAIATVLDLAYFYPGLEAYPMLDTLYMKFMIPSSARRGDAIIAISENTRLDLLRFVPDLQPENLSVVQLAPATVEKSQEIEQGSYVRQKYSLGDQPYIFMSSSLSPRKNLERVLIAFAGISTQLPHQLVLTGGKQWGATKVHEILQRPQLAGRFKLLGHVPESDLPAIYQGADLYLMPSLYEGFSMTILEAMQHGCPVAVSNVSSHPEVAGDAAVYFDPYIIDDIASAILRVLHDRNLHAQLRERGRLRVSEFSWQRCARETKEIIHRVAAAR